MSGFGFLGQKMCGGLGQSWALVNLDGFGLWKTVGLVDRNWAVIP